MQVAPGVAIPEDELDERFILAGGPGGQNVNKVATAVQLRFDVAGSPTLPPEVRQRLLRSAGARVTGDGELVISARRYRTREANRRDARMRLAALVARALQAPRPRHATRPTPRRPASGGCRTRHAAAPSNGSARGPAPTSEPRSREATGGST